MSREKKLAAWRAMAEGLACGRTSAEQVESIRTYGSHGASPVLRAATLAAHGIPKPKAKAQNCVIFGCYRPFSTPFLLQQCIRLMDMLNIDYTYLDREYCCGIPLIMIASKEELGDAMAAGGEFNQMNFDLARQKGASKLAYCCAGCVHAARSASTGASDSHVYVLDLILDALEQKPLEAPPEVIGYFEGCHTFVRSAFKDVRLDWSRYRKRMGEIKGLEIVDLPNNLCCKRSAAEIIDTAAKLNLTKILCPCSGCYSSLSNAAQATIRPVTVPELLLQSLEHTALSRNA